MMLKKGDEGKQLKRVPEGAPAAPGETMFPTFFFKPLKREEALATRGFRRGGMRSDGREKGKGCELRLHPLLKAQAVTG